MEPRTAVTGSTGTVGGMVARTLADEGVPLILPVRSPRRAEQLPDAEIRECSYADGEAAEQALAGVDVLFMVSAAEEEDRVGTHRTFIDAAARAGVQHIVYTSFLGAAPDAAFLLGRDHWHTEEHIRASGMAWTFLRDNLYLDVVPALAEDGVIRGPAGDGALSAVARSDVAASAAAILRSPADHINRTYHLTGPEAFTLTEASATITELTPTSVRFEDETHEEALASRAHHGVPDWQVEAWVSTYTAIARGEMSHITDDVERLTGKQPLGLRELLMSKGRAPSIRRDVVPDPANRRAFYKFLTAVVVPRPIAWVSSTSAEGVDNLAPHSFFTIASVNPPIVQFTSVGRKDSVRNIEATGEFVVAFTPEHLFEAVNATGTDFPPDVSEIDSVGLTREPSTTVAPPRIRESPVALECRLHLIQDMGDCTLVFGEVLHAVVSEDVLDGDLPAIGALKPLSRLGKNEWGTAGRIRDITRIPVEEWPGHYAKNAEERTDR